MRYRIKFPCGLEIFMKFGILDFVDGEFDLKQGCPIHGKQCCGGKQNGKN